MKLAQNSCSFFMFKAIFQTQFFSCGILMISMISMHLKVANAWWKAQRRVTGLSHWPSVTPPTVWMTNGKAACRKMWRQADGKSQEKEGREMERGWQGEPEEKKRRWFGRQLFLPHHEVTNCSFSVHMSVCLSVNPPFVLYSLCTLKEGVMTEPWKRSKDFPVLLYFSVSLL